ncbi:hypothetical protein PV10_00331 [Exophiala mesophila]|uniref:FAD-binding domain-containing protein n=1 Tax=Exophiala mesophila TaxID=212818 RepID=A0A0D1Y6X1_EXOME|nr:uncharacterized protein PV10_00331 [Exophiala mesophila]KIV96461.1 hypothetical protein PV10_00331 [Exophiala mesophila]
MRVLIIGGGVAGLASALALTKWDPEIQRITIAEIRNQPTTIGGAVGLTPNALRCLHHLGVLEHIRRGQSGTEIDLIEIFAIHTGAKLGEIKFIGPSGEGVGDPKLKGLRIMRADLMRALLDAVELNDKITIEYDRKASQIDTETDEVRVSFADGHSTSVDLLLGCDGIHSFTRTNLVDIERMPSYSGISAAFTVGELDPGAHVPWKDTGLCQSQWGALMTTYLEPTRTKQFMAAIMETPDVKSKDGWRARATEQENIKNNIKERFGNSAVKFLDPLIEATNQWTLYPVYNLAPKGKWSTHRVMLLGDAAHAMPPQGESTAHALEDAIIFARILAKHKSGGLDVVFKKYEDIRRPSIDRAYEESVFGWDTQKDSGWISFLLKTWMTSAFLWWTAAARSKRYAEDVASMELE